MINREHKDRLFSFMFGSSENKRWTLELYNAVNGTDYSDPDEIEINTIRDVLYMGMKNDASFIIRGDMNLYAHQSTYNPNMPLREFMYAALLYDKYISTRKANIYGGKLIEIPVPKLVTFYNGTDDTADEVILEMKDAFPEGTDPDTSDIQVRVRMININFGRNKALLDACKPLMEYSWLIDRIRVNKANKMDIETAVDVAINDMPDDFEIKSFLIENKSEVRAMCITEYNEAETMQMFKEEGREEGREEGIKGIIAVCKSFGGSSLDAVEKIVATMGYSQSEADSLVSKYW